MLGFLMLSKERFQNATPTADWLGRSSAAPPEASSSRRSGLLSMIISEQPEDKDGGCQLLEARAQESHNACFLWARAGNQAATDSQKEHRDSASCW